MYASGLAPAVFTNRVVAYFKTAYENLPPAKTWTWKKNKKPEPGPAGARQILKYNKTLISVRIFKEEQNFTFSSEP